MALKVNDYDYNTLVWQLIKDGRLNGVQLDIATTYVKKGEKALSERDKKYLDNIIIDKYSSEECKRCSNNIPLSDMGEALDNGGFCSHCSYAMRKENEE